jgi:thiol-disulfide isomerase/thioredoxin
MEKPEVGFKAPTFTLKGLDGKTYTLNETKKPIVLNFWASWCGPCRTEAPELVRLNNKYKDKIQFYAVNITSQDNMNDIKSFVKEFNFTLPVLLDEKGEVSNRYLIQAIPTTFFINDKGVIIDKVMGITTPADFESKINKAIKHK